METTQADPDAELQNALARFGATHLRESADVLVSQPFEDVVAVVREALLSGSPRLITALAPVIVANIDALRLDRLRARLSDAGLERRLLWVLENVRVAVNACLERTPARRPALRLGRSLVVLGAFLDGPQGAASNHGRHEGRDVLDADIRSVKSLAGFARASTAEPQALLRARAAGRCRHGRLPAPLGRSPRRRHPRPRRRSRAPHRSFCELGRARGERRELPQGGASVDTMARRAEVEAFLQDSRPGKSKVKP